MDHGPAFPHFLGILVPNPDHMDQVRISNNFFNPKIIEIKIEVELSLLEEKELKYSREA